MRPLQARTSERLMKRWTTVALALLTLASIPLGCVPVEKETTVIDDDGPPTVTKETTIVNPPDVKVETNP